MVKEADEKQRNIDEGTEEDLWAYEETGGDTAVGVNEVSWRK